LLKVKKAMPFRVADRYSGHFLTIDMIMSSCFFCLAKAAFDGLRRISSMTCLIMALSLMTVGSTGFILTPIQNSCFLNNTAFVRKRQAARRFSLSPACYTVSRGVSLPEPGMDKRDSPENSGSSRLTMFPSTHHSRQ
jgi:hypothetical protein